MTSFDIRSSSRFVFGNEPLRGDYAAEIARLQAQPQRPAEQTRQLAEMYIELAIVKQEEGDFEDAAESFSAANALLNEILQSPQVTDELRHLYAISVMSWASTQEEIGDNDLALSGYTIAIETLKPLEAQGDVDAKFDLAGIRFNRATIFHALGEYQQADTDFDAAFLAFRALEKISDLEDTRLLMARISAAQGNLARDAQEPLAKIDDMYNRAMRLYIELVESGEIAIEHDLAVVLLDRCIARFDNLLDSDLDLENSAGFDPILIDMTRGIEILERQLKAGNDAVWQDLFCALLSHATMLLDIERYTESEAIFHSLIARFADLEKSDDPAMRARMAGVYENLSHALVHQEKTAEAMKQIALAIRIRESILRDYADELQDEKVDYVCDLSMAYCQRGGLRRLQGESVAEEIKLLQSLCEKYLADSPDESEMIAAQIELLQSEE